MRAYHELLRLLPRIVAESALVTIGICHITRQHRSPQKDHRFAVHRPSLAIALHHLDHCFSSLVEREKGRTLADRILLRQAILKVRRELAARPAGHHPIGLARAGLGLTQLRNDFDQRQTIVDILRRYLGGAHRQEMDTGVVSSPRRKRQSTANGIASWGRTASNNSSNSSDILVAGPAAHTTPTRPEQQRALPARSPWSKSADMAVPTTTHYWWGRLKIHFGSNAAKEAFRNIVKSKPNPISCPNRTSSAHIDNLSEDDEGQEGPNHLGTYSKQYTLDHPEIKWMHRGSGRYVKADDLRPDFPVTSPRSTRYVKFERFWIISVTCATTDSCLDKLLRSTTLSRHHSPMSN